MSTDVDLDDLHRMSLDEYHRLIEAGAFDDFPRIELIDGLLVRKECKSRAHENAIAWLARWLMFGVDQIARAAPRPYHPSTAALVVEVSVSSLRRDLERKPELYAQAAIAEYWVVDIAGRRIVVHGALGAAGYADVREVSSGERIASPPAGLPALDVDELLLAAEL